jgi:hypothetical protein
MQPYLRVAIVLLLTTSAYGSPTGSIRASGHLIPWEEILSILEFVCAGDVRYRSGEVVSKKVNQCHPCPCFPLNWGKNQTALR